jgi:hypothetical protein
MPACDSLLCSDTLFTESITSSNPALQQHLHLHSRLSCSLHNPAFLFQRGRVLRMQRGQLGGGSADGVSSGGSLLAGLCATFEHKLGDTEESVQKRIGTSFNVLLADSNCSICMSMLLMARASAAAFASAAACASAAALASPAALASVSTAWLKSARYMRCVSEQMVESALDWFPTSSLTPTS